MNKQVKIIIKDKDYYCDTEVLKLIERLQDKIELLEYNRDKALKLCNRYIANEKSNCNPDYYYLSMFEEIKKELSKGSEE